MVGRMWQRARTWLDRRPAVLPLLLLGSLLIALAAGPAPSEGAWTGIPDTQFFRWVAGVIVGLLALVGFLMILASRGAANRGETKRKSWVATLAGSLLLLALVSLIDYDGELLEPEEVAVPPLLEPELPPGQPVEPGPGFETSDATALIVILIVAILLLVWTRRSITDAVEPVVEPSPLDASLTRAESHLLTGSDPREAVMLAYRELETTLASLDLPRRETETPNEHLARALRALSITDRDQAGPLTDLATLYAKARYSDHHITEAEQHRAGVALGQARRRLVGAG